MASYSSKFGKEKRRDPKKERESIAWVKNLFAKGTVQDMPEWYNDNRRRTYTSRQSMFVFGNENENNTLLDKTNKKMSRTPNENQRKKSFDDRLKTIHMCKDEMTRVKLELPVTPNVPAGVEDASKWICDSAYTDPLACQGDGTCKLRKKMSQMYQAKIDEKCNVAIDLLVEKMEKGKLPLSEWQKCEPTMQYGIDQSPTPSRCELQQRETKDYVEDLKAAAAATERTREYAKTPSRKSEKESEAPPEGSCARFSPIMDLEVEDYVKEPSTEFILKISGAMNDDGELLRELKDLNEVQDYVQNVLIDWARKLIAGVPIPIPNSQQPREESQILAAPVDHLRKYDAMKQVLHNENQDFKRKHCRSFTRLSERSGQKSVAPERIQEIVSRLKMGMSMVVDLDGVSFELTEKRISSLLEILPFEYRPSFDDEPTHQMVDPIQFPEFQRKISVKKSMKDRTSGGAAATASGNCIRRIKSPIYAQLHDEDLMDIQDCISGEELEAQKLSFAQWENRQLVQDLQKHSDLTEYEEHLLLVMQYFAKWLDLTKKNRVLRKYVTPGIPKAWEGPYPAYALRMIKCVKGEANFAPLSETEFFRKFKKVEKKMFDSIQATLDNFSKPLESEEQEDTEEDTTEAEEEVSDEEDEFDENEEIPIPEQSEDEEAEDGEIEEYDNDEVEHGETEEYDEDEESANNVELRNGDSYLKKGFEFEQFEAEGVSEMEMNEQL